VAKVNQKPGLEDSLQNLRQQVQILAESTEDGALREEAFTRWALDLAHEKGDIEGGDPYPVLLPRVGKVSGCYHDAETAELDIIVSEYAGVGAPETMGSPDLEGLVNGAIRLTTKLASGHGRELEESSPGFAFGEIIRSISIARYTIRVMVFTDRVCPRLPKKTFELLGSEVTVSVWDLERIHNSLTSGKEREEIIINLVAPSVAGRAIPFIRTPDGNDTYDTYLTMIPGPLLASIYREHGPRLLEQNVRSFLQARGKVNKGIRDTILEEPHMFLAYNNGLCATAEAVEIAEDDGTVANIRSITNFQIVNGGQTTASLAAAARKDKADLSAVQVQLKLSVIKKADKAAEIVGNIARFANSQNKVSDADLHANEIFHVKLEELSRTVWAPRSAGDTHDSKWFYERARGQYVDERGRRTVGQQKVFDAEYPKPKWFTKTDIAKFENTWEQLPQMVSGGAQKNFAAFQHRLNQRRGFVPDVAYFQGLIAKAILFKKAEKIVSAQEFGGYRANIVTYTLAWIFHRTGRGIDLAKIWKDQGLDDLLTELITDACGPVFREIQRSAKGAQSKNLSEWAKKDNCWEHVRESDLGLKAWEPFLSKRAKNAPATSGSSELSSNTPEQDDLIREVASHAPEIWFGIAKWAKETGSLQGWQRALAFSLGRLLENGKKPSVKQAVQGEKLMSEVKRLGFREGARKAG
jgi:hypothetical protein